MLKEGELSPDDLPIQYIIRDGRKVRLRKREIINTRNKYSTNICRRYYKHNITSRWRCRN